MFPSGKIILTLLLLSVAIYFIARVTTNLGSPAPQTKFLPGRTFAVAGHVRSGENFVANPALGAMADFLESHGVSTLFLNGDTVLGNISEVEAIPREWKAVDEALEKFSGKVYFVSGNHDLSTPELSRYYQEHVAKPVYAFTPTPESHGYKPMDELSKTAKRINKSHERSPLVWGFTQEDVHFIILDSTGWINDETSRHSQLEFLKGELELWPTESPFVIFLHHPVWMDEKGNEGRAMELVANYPNNRKMADFWLKEVAPLFSGRQGAVLSGDAGRSRVKYTYKKEGELLYLLNGFDWRADADENVFFIFSVEGGSIRAFPVSLMATPQICKGLNLLYRTDILGVPYWSRILNLSLRLPSFTTCTYGNII